MDVAGIVNLVRRHLNDMDGAVFSDEELARFVRKAAEEYSEDSKAFRGEAPFAVGDDGGGGYSAGCLGVLRAFDEYGHAVLATSSHRAAFFRGDYRSSPGRPVQVMYDDQDGDGGYRLSPVPEQDSVEHYDETGYGIFTQYYGGVFGYSYGIVFAWRQIEDIGGYQFIRSAAPEEVQDHLALVYHAVAQALNADTDLARGEGSVQLYKGLYADRLGSRRGVARHDALTARDGNFF